VKNSISFITNYQSIIDQQIKLEQTIDELFLFLDRNKFQGWEPYKIIKFRNRLVPPILRVCLTQLIRLSPFFIHPYLSRKDCDAKAAALFARAFLALFEVTKEIKYHRKGILFLEWLKDHRCTSTRHYSVGNQYQLSMKNYCANPGTPAPLITCFAIEAFLSAYKILKDQSYLELAESGVNYFLEELPQVKISSDQCYFIYHPNHNQFIPNAPAVICGTLSHFYSISKRQELLNIIRHNLNYIISCQREDGSWLYHPQSRYIDSFHTAFILEALVKYQQYTGDDAYEKQFLKGLSFYEQTLFKSNYQPIHKKRSGFPTNVDSLLTKIDLRDIAMGLILFNQLVNLKGYPITQALNLLNWSFENFRSIRGYYYYQKVPLYRIKNPFLSMQAWMLYGLSMTLKSLTTLKMKWLSDFKPGATSEASTD
jgi:hypothetical protein